MLGVLLAAFRPRSAHVVLLGTIRAALAGHQDAPCACQIDPVFEAFGKIRDIQCRLSLHNPLSPSGAKPQGTIAHRTANTCLASSRIKSNRDGLSGFQEGMKLVFMRVPLRAGHSLQKLWNTTDDAVAHSVLDAHKTGRRCLRPPQEFVSHIKGWSRI